MQRLRDRRAGADLIRQRRYAQIDAYRSFGKWVRGTFGSALMRRL
jgi:hypothetical protein